MTDFAETPRWRYDGANSKGERMVFVEQHDFSALRSCFGHVPVRADPGVQPVVEPGAINRRQPGEVSDRA